MKDYKVSFISSIVQPVEWNEYEDEPTDWFEEEMWSNFNYYKNNRISTIVIENDDEREEYPFWWLQQNGYVDSSKSIENMCLELDEAKEIADRLMEDFYIDKQSER